MPARRPRSNADATIAPAARRTSLSMAGILYGLTTLFLAVGAVNGQNNLLFWAFGLSLGGLLISGLFSGAGMMGLRLHRAAPSTARAGEPITLRYRISNANRVMPLYCVTLTERLARTPRGHEAPKPSIAFLPHSPARSEATLHAPSRPMRRGPMRLTGVTASSSFPFGLMRKIMDFEFSGSILVLPARLQLRGDLIPRPARRGHGGAASPSGIGNAEEFFGVREYVPGDPTRLIAWRASARGEELVVRQHGTPPPTIVWVVLDIADGDDVLERERAIALTASLVELLAARGCAVGLSIEGSGEGSGGHPGVSRLPAPGAWHAHRLVSTLASFDAAPADSKARRGRRSSRGRDGTGADGPINPANQVPLPTHRATSRIRRDHAALVVHARGPDDRSSSTGAPAWATHLWSKGLASYLAPGAEIPDPLLPPPPRETLIQKRARLIREFLLVDPVGEVAMGDSSTAALPPGAPTTSPPSPPRPARSSPRTTAKGAAA